MARPALFWSFASLASLEEAREANFGYGQSGALLLLAKRSLEPVSLAMRWRHSSEQYHLSDD